MDRDTTLELFDELADEVVQSLEQLSDWGLSGQRATQYHHDVVADEIIIPRLLKAGFKVLSEESGLVGENGAAVVVVDPVDGSTNGSRGLPWYATSLCAVDDGGPAVALVANLATGERFRAVRDGGMELRTVAPVGKHLAGKGYLHGPGTTGCTDIGDAIIGFSGLPPSHGGWAQFRALGAAALDMCAVAVGRLDGFVDIDRAHGVWDYLGATLICTEAGVAVGEAARQDLVVLDPEARRGPVIGATEELLAVLMAMVDGWRSTSS